MFFLAVLAPADIGKNSTFTSSAKYLKKWRLLAIIATSVCLCGEMVGSASGVARSGEPPRTWDPVAVSHPVMIHPLARTIWRPPACMAHTPISNIWTHAYCKFVKQVFNAHLYINYCTVKFITQFRSDRNILSSNLPVGRFASILQNLCIFWHHFARWQSAV